MVTDHDIFVLVPDSCRSTVPNDTSIRANEIEHIIG